MWLRLGGVLSRLRPDGGEHVDDDDEDAAQVTFGSAEMDRLERRADDLDLPFTQQGDPDGRQFGLTRAERQRLKRAALNEDLDAVFDVAGLEESLRRDLRGEELPGERRGRGLVTDIRDFVALPYTAVGADGPGRRFVSQWYDDYSIGVGSAIGARWNDVARFLAHAVYGTPGTSEWRVKRMDGLDPSDPTFDDLRRLTTREGKSFQAQFGAPDRGLTEGERRVREAIEAADAHERPDRLTRERREWSGRQDNATADKDFYALHYEARLTVPQTNRLLNRYQSADRVLFQARNNPDALTTFSGVSSRSIEKLRAIDPAEAILTPAEREARAEEQRREQQRAAERRQERALARTTETFGSFESGDVERTVIFVGCGAQKQETAAPARTLYTSTYFTVKREFAETFADQWYVLSAEYGLVAPDEVIEPYDTTLSGLVDWQVQRWADDVQQALPNLSSARVVVLAGRDYVAPLRSVLAAEAADLRLPLAGLGIGEQMGWLREQIDAFDGSTPAWLEPTAVPESVNGWALETAAGDGSRYEWFAPGSEQFGPPARDGIEAIGGGNRWYVRTFTARPKRQQSLDAFATDPDTDTAFDRSAYTTLRLSEMNATRDGAIERAITYMERVPAPGHAAATEEPEETEGTDS